VTEPVRVRFSPAPTGTLHVGSARTALFNYLFARHAGRDGDAEFRLRIEDTDLARSRPEWAERIARVLRALGLDWDGEPVHQSDRFDLYREAVERLLAGGHAYECFETPEELEAINAERRAAGLPPGYDGRARHLSDDDKQRRRVEGRAVTIRFRTPDEGVSTFHDLVRGEVTVPWSTISDFVIVRSDGTPVFYLANAVDDLEMGITHVIRGEDLIDSTHRVLALRAALGGGTGPEYAHLPLIIGEGGAKLSKRHGAVAVEDFLAQGYLAEALVNYLALLGWSPEDGREVLARDELVGAFQLERVTHSAARFDYAKLDWMNGEWIRRLPVDELLDRIGPFVRDRYGDAEPPDVRRLTELGQERAVTLVSLVEQMDFLLEPDEAFSIDDDAWAKVARVDRVGDAFAASIAHLEHCDWIVGDRTGTDLRPALEAAGIKVGKVIRALYLAIEGRPAGLPLFDSIHLLGRERALERLRRARDRLR
jgi:glutamyl-tRNA synthetase